MPVFRDGGKISSWLQLNICLIHYLFPCDLIKGFSFLQNTFSPFKKQLLIAAYFTVVLWEKKKISNAPFTFWKRKYYHHFPLSTEVISVCIHLYSIIPIIKQEGSQQEIDTFFLLEIMKTNLYAKLTTKDCLEGS